MSRLCSKGCILRLDFLSTKIVINSQAVALARLYTTNVAIGKLLLVEQLAPRSLDVARATSLLCTLRLGWVVGHGLDAQAARPGEAIENNRSARHHAADGS